jgi:hypothetical protein
VNEADEAKYWIASDKFLSAINEEWQSPLQYLDLQLAGL